MGRFVCTSAEVIQKEGKTPYIEVTFKEKASNMFAQHVSRELRMSLVGGKFTEDNKPDIAANLKWAQESAPTMVGVETDIDGFDVPCEPIIRFKRDGSPMLDADGKLQQFNTVTIYQFSEFNKDTGEVQPIGGWDRLRAQKDRLLKFSSRIKTVAELKKQQEAKKAAEEAKKAVNEGGSNPLTSDVLSNASILDGLD